MQRGEVQWMKDSQKPTDVVNLFEWHFQSLMSFHVVSSWLCKSSMYLERPAILMDAWICCIFITPVTHEDGWRYPGSLADVPDSLFDPLAPMICYSSPRGDEYFLSGDWAETTYSFVAGELSSQLISMILIPSDSWPQSVYTIIGLKETPSEK